MIAHGWQVNALIADVSLQEKEYLSLQKWKMDGK